MTHVFLLQTHKDPAQIRRLVRTLRRGYANSVVLVSHNGALDGLDRAFFDNDSEVHVIAGQGGRGDFTILDGYLDALRWLRTNGIRYEWITNLSGQDYPVSSLAEFAAELERTTVDGFLHYFDVLEGDAENMWPMSLSVEAGFDRYWFKYKKLKDNVSLFERAALRLPRQALERFNAPYRINASFGLMVGRRADRVPFDEQFRCYAGSYWQTLRARCSAALLRFVDERPDVVDYFRSVLIPDESFVQTVLVNEPGLKFERNNRRYIDMRGSRHGHPKVLGMADIPEITRRPYVFARKFEAAKDPEVFDHLDKIALA